MTKTRISQSVREVDGYIQESDYEYGKFYIGDTGRDLSVLLADMRHEALSYIADDLASYTLTFTAECTFFERHPGSDQGVFRIAEVGIKPDWMNRAQDAALPDVPPTRERKVLKGQVLRRDVEFFIFDTKTNTEIPLVANMERVLTRVLEPFTKHGRSVHAVLLLEVEQTEKQRARSA